MISAPVRAAGGNAAAFAISPDVTDRPKFPNVTTSYTDQ